MEMDKKNIFNYKLVSTGDYRLFAEFPRQFDAYQWVSDLLERVAKFSLMSELNTIQRECKDKFPDKIDIPIIIVNHILYRYGIKIIEA